jgi:hypothetical protein
MRRERYGIALNTSDTTDSDGAQTKTTWWFPRFLSKFTRIRCETATRIDDTLTAAFPVRLKEVAAGDSIER